VSRNLDEFLDRQKFADAVERCIDKGVTERPPVKGIAYAAFAVHPQRPGNLLGLAVAHRDGGMVIVDLVKGDIGFAEAAAVLESYGVTRAAAAVGDEADALAHAVAGVVHELQRGLLQ
jgi:hypothetical protein